MALPPVSMGREERGSSFFYVDFFFLLFPFTSPFGAWGFESPLHLAPWTIFSFS